MVFKPIGFNHNQLSLFIVHGFIDDEIQDRSFITLLLLVLTQLFISLGLLYFSHFHHHCPKIEVFIALVTIHMFHLNTKIHSHLSYCL
jgi:hypothetical protein